MQKQSFWKSLSSRNRYMVGNLFFLYLIQGVFTILIGSILPMLKTEYGLDYQMGGFLISAHSIGNSIFGLISGFLPLLIGLKKSLISLNVLPFAGFAIALLTGNPILLIFAFLLTGIGRGSISNYNNQIISTLSQGSAAPLNALHGFFAIGAVSAPFLVLFCTKSGNTGWRYAVYVVIALGVISMITSPFMKMDDVSYSKESSSGASFGFLKEHRFLITVAIMFCYLCVEASVMGWMVTYYIDSGVATQDFAQVLTSLLWLVILIGRFACSALAGKFSPPRMILFLTSGIVLFLGILLLSQSFAPMLIGTIGLGLFLSGMYGTVVANAGSVFSDYPLCMSIFVTIAGIGSAISPSLIGSIAERSNIRIGMAILLIPAVLTVLLSIYNTKTAQKNN